MNRYYTDIVPVELAEKLKETGMPVEIVDDSVEERPDCNDCHCETMYAEVFDWLMSEQGISIAIVPRWGYVKNAVQDYMPVVNYLSLDYFRDWHEAANAAIEKALELIKKQQPMKEFNLEAAKNGAPVCTRDGRKAKILCFDFKNNGFPIVARVENAPDKEMIFRYTSDGIFEKRRESPADLVMASVKKEGWVNMYNSERGDRTVKIEWEE